MSEPLDSQARPALRYSTLAIVLVFLAAGLAGSALCLRFFPLPFAWTAGIWALLFFAGVWYHQGSSRALMFNLAFLFAVIGAAEGYLAFVEKDEPVYAGQYYGSDDLLGYAPNASTGTRAFLQHLGSTVYDVTYTIGPDRLRIAPPSENASNSVLFFGCSFTYGEGVQDDEALPFQAGLQSEGRFQTHNFGFHGYAPNQMLASIESGRLANLVALPPRYAIYQALPDHVARVSGKIPYGKHSPRYVLNADGTVTLAGHFDDGGKKPSALQLRLRGQLKKSATYRTITSIEPAINENDVRLLLAIVRQSRDKLVAQYPGIEFHVLLWRNFSREKKLHEQLLAGFGQLNIPVHRIERVLPGYDAAPEQYWLSPHDQHPNAMANRLIADYVVTRILSSPSQQENRAGESTGAQTD